MKKFILLIVLILAGCVTQEVRKTPAPQASAAAVKEFREAMSFYKAKKLGPALKKFTGFIQRYPQTGLTDDAQFYAGQIYYDQGDYQRAAHFWTAIVDSQMTSEFYERALIGAGQAQTQSGHYDEALALLSRFKIKEDSDKELAARVLELSGKLKLQKGDALGALQDILGAGDLKQKPQEKQNLMTEAIEIINGNLSQKQLEDIISSATFQSVELPARYRLSVLLYDQKSWSSARKEFSNISDKFPNTDFSQRAQQYIAIIDARERTEASTIGVILPLSGKYAPMGYKTLRGVQMGLGLFGKSRTSPMKLAIIDSEGNPDVARRGVERLVSEDHVIAIIGDIISKTAQAVASKSQELGVPCLTLSQKQGLNDIGDFVFRNTLTPDMQMQALVDLAMVQRGFKKFAIIYPNDSYGTEYATVFWDHVLLRGGQITAAQTYQPDETDFRTVVQRLVGTFYKDEDRGKEWQLRLTAWQKDQATKAAREKPPKDLLPPVVDFDAVFIPDSPKAIGQIGPMLAYNDVENIPLIGTNLWNTPQIVTRGGKFVENSLFIDGFFAEDPNPQMKKFSGEFQSIFGYKPDVFEAQGYDSAQLLYQVIRSYNFSINRVSLRDRLATAINIPGATGPLKISPQREVEKSLIPLTVTKGRIVKVGTEGVSR